MAPMLHSLLDKDGFRLRGTELTRGLEDSATIFINAMLLFFILLYVYPLKFLFTMTTKLVLRTTRCEVFSDPVQIREHKRIHGVYLGGKVKRLHEAQHDSGAAE